MLDLTSASFEDLLIYVNRTSDFTPQELSQLNRVTRELVEKKSDDKSFLFLRGYFLEKTELDLKEAVAWYKKLCEVISTAEWKLEIYGLQENRATINFRIGAIDILLENKVEAIEYLKSSFKLDSSNFDAISLIISIYKQTDKEKAKVIIPQLLNSDDWRFYYFNAVIQSEEGKLLEAYQNAKKAFDMNPKALKPKILAAQCLHDLPNRDDEAESILISVFSNNIDDVEEDDLYDAQSLMADILYGKHEYIETRFIYQNLLESNKNLSNYDRSRVSVRIGDTYEAAYRQEGLKEDLLKAEEAYKRAISFNPANGKAHGRLGWLFFITGKDSFTEFKLASEMGYDDWIEKVMYRLESYDFSSDTDTSSDEPSIDTFFIKKMEKLCEQQSADNSLKLLLAKAYFINGKQDNAVLLLENILKNLSEGDQELKLQILIGLRIIYFKKGDIDKAFDLMKQEEAIAMRDALPLVELEEQLSKNPKNIENILTIADSHMKIGSSDQALLLLDRTKSNYPKVKVKRAEVLLSLGRFEEALSYLNSAYKEIKEPEQKSTILFEIAKTYSGTKRYKDAELVFEQLYKKGQYLIEYADFLMIKDNKQIKNLKKAEQLLEKALKTNTSNDIIYYKLSCVHYELKNYQQALDLIKKAIANKPLFDMYWNKLYEIYNAMGLFVMAKSIITNRPNVIDPAIISYGTIGKTIGLSVIGDSGHGCITYIIANIINDNHARLVRTGNLLAETQESAEIAYNLALKTAEKTDAKLHNNSVHIHLVDEFANTEYLPQRDGPSAGVAIYSAIMSAVMKKPVTKKIAMTGGINPDGSIFAVGGIPEKVQAAFDRGIRHLILPKTNEENIALINLKLQEQMTFSFVETSEEVIKILL